MQIDRNACRGVGKIDHLPGKTKDVSDCLSVVAIYLTHHLPAWMLAGKIEGASYAVATAHTLGGTVTSIPAPQIDYMALIREQRGMPSR